ncbi:hypothetical protein SprV_0100005100 [Sparganum proliferum]
MELRPANCDPLRLLPVLPPPPQDLLELRGLHQLSLSSNGSSKGHCSSRQPTKTPIGKSLRNSHLDGHASDTFTTGPPHCLCVSSGSVPASLGSALTPVLG